MKPDTSKMIRSTGRLAVAIYKQMQGSATPEMCMIAYHSMIAKEGMHTA
jgi:hypothetical protein